MVADHLSRSRDEVVGTVRETAFGGLTMIRLPGDEFVTVELVDDPDCDGVIDPGGLNHLVIQVESMNKTIADLTAETCASRHPVRPATPRTSGRAGPLIPTVTASSCSMSQPATQKA